jgi:hypothetical protein
LQQPLRLSLFLIPFLPGRYKSPKAPANKANKTPKTFIPLFVHGAIKTIPAAEVPINNLQNVLSQKTATNGPINSSVTASPMGILYGEIKNQIHGPKAQTIGNYNFPLLSNLE